MALQASSVPLSYNNTFEWVNDSEGPLDDEYYRHQALQQALLEQQRQETNQLIHLEYTRLSVALKQQRKELYEFLFKILGDKNQEIEIAKKRCEELEACLKRGEMEVRKLKRVSEENEAVAFSLNNTLQRIQVPGFSSSKVSFRDEEFTMAWNKCSACGCEDSCFLFMPCMHVCACRECGVHLQACPLCGIIKRKSIEVFFQL